MPDWTGGGSLMSEPLVLVVLLGTSPDPTADAIMTTARRALGPEAIVLAETSATTSDDDALAIAERVHARAVARVTWADGSFRVARLHVHVAPSSSSDWANDEITFQPQDVASEKGRTVGYTLASMVQRIEQEHEAAAPKAPPPAPPPPTPPPAPSVAPTERPLARPPASRSALDVHVHGIGVIGADASGVGGGGAVRWWPGSHIGFRAGAGARGGRIEAANASTTTVSLAVGPGYRTMIATTLELGLRADFVVLRHAVTREDTTHARWLGAVDLLVELGWAVSAHGGVVASLGSEVALGTTSIRVGGADVGDLPTLRGIAELGARFRF